MYSLQNDDSRVVFSLSVFVVLCVLLNYTRESENLPPRSLMRFQAFAQLSEHYVKAYTAIVCSFFVLTHFYVYYEGKERPEF
jgi:hypothetical protein